MKIPASIRQIHADQAETNQRLRTEIDRLMLGLKDRRWHYESRVKELDSFALKVESGRFGAARQLEDFFACTVVVPNATEVAAAETLIVNTFTLARRRPEHADRTHKSPDSFPFDDLRLYVSVKADPSLPPERSPNDLVGIVFELQVKTFLQHAWSIATHDLVYKTDEANWSKERIAYQIKAMLEHAEISIQEADKLAASDAMAKEDVSTTDLRASIALVRDQWSPDELPKDIRRLADNITRLRRALRMEIADLERVINGEKARLGNSHPANLSPYGVIVQYLINVERGKMMRALTASNSRFKILIPTEIDLPPDFDPKSCANAIFLS
jgi:ppGpp synthetase/RelA/SpoT-type nucleotidyltranferase